MKRKAPILVSICLIVGLAQSQLAAEPPTSIAPPTYFISLPIGQKNTLALSSIRGAGVRDCLLYTNLESFLEFIGGLPQGSRLDHDAGCVVPTSYEIGDKTIAIKNLRAYCDERRIKLHIYGSW